MISRRLLRIKILQILYACRKSEKSIPLAEKELLFSIQKTYELYHYLLLLILDIVRFAESRISLAKGKKIPTYDDLHPNTKFIDNLFIKQLEVNEQLNDFIDINKLNWRNHSILIKDLYSKITHSEKYIEFINKKNKSYEDDKKIISNIFSSVFYNNEQLFQNLEEQCIYWNDDIDFIISKIIKTIAGFRETDDKSVPLMRLYKSDDDKDFVIKLFRKAVLNNREYKKLIEQKSKNWDIERIAFMDILIMQLAIAEMIEFPSIPTKVTFNEYLEISKSYSTQKSCNFINGILDKIISHLKENKIIVKQGRGLIGEI